MTVLTDRPAPGPPVPAPGADAEALFREARRRRRRRRAAMAAVVALVLVAAGVVWQVALRTPAHLPATGTGPGGHTRTATPGRTSGRSLAAALRYTPVQTAGLAGPGAGWAASESGLYLTVDGGRHWRTVTPANMAHENDSNGIGQVVAVGGSDLWATLIGVPGLVPYADSIDGSDRGDGIDRSTDGGRTWTFAPLPGCLQACAGGIFLSFLTARTGFAAAGTDPTQIFATADGGATWTRAGSLPTLAGSVMDGPAPEPQFAFTSAENGWAVTGPAFGAAGQQTATSGALYRTVDGGATWTPVPGLPAGNQYALPTFFGSRDGVVLANPDGAPEHSSVFVTSDGGSTWSAHRVPAFGRLTSYKPVYLRFLFAAISPVDWKIDSGSAFYSTTDAGRAWVRSVPRPALPTFDVRSIAFLTPRRGIAISLSPACVRAPDDAACYPTLTTTSDGGQRWVPVRL